MLSNELIKVDYKGLSTITHIFSLVKKNCNHLPRLARNSTIFFLLGSTMNREDEQCSVVKYMRFEIPPNPLYNALMSLRFVGNSILKSYTPGKEHLTNWLNRLKFRLSAAGSEGKYHETLSNCIFYLFKCVCCHDQFSFRC